MNDNGEKHLPTRLILLLVYQWILVLASLGYSAAMVIPIWDAAGPLVLPAFVACWGMAMGFASIGIMRRSRQGFLLGMICHLLLEIPGLPSVLFFGGMYVWMSTSSSQSSRAWADLPLMFALMWLPFVLISAWAFFFLRRIRKSVVVR